MRQSSSERSKPRVFPLLLETHVASIYSRAMGTTRISFVATRLTREIEPCKKNIATIPTLIASQVRYVSKRTENRATKPSSPGQRTEQ